MLQYGDYVWSQGSLDAVVTEVSDRYRSLMSAYPITPNPPLSVRLHSGSLQLLEQLENTGPPPAEKEMISLLPTVCISQEQTGNTRKGLAWMKDARSGTQLTGNSLITEWRHLFDKSAVQNVHLVSRTLLGAFGDVNSIWGLLYMG